jgi:hypothetical protein
LMNFDSYAKSRASVAGLVAEAKATKEAAAAAKKAEEDAKKAAEDAKKAEEDAKKAEAVPEKLPEIEVQRTEGL